MSYNEKKFRMTEAGNDADSVATMAPVLDFFSFFVLAYFTTHVMRRENQPV